MGTGNIGAVILFEWKRALTVPRIAWWAALTLFPVLMVTLIRLTAFTNPPREAWAFFLFALAPMLISMLGTFLWTAPAVSSELEQKSWSYLAIRPNGSTAVLLGKYLVAVTWVLPAALVGLTISVLVADIDDGWRIWTTMVRLVCLSCPAYAAVYLVLGTIIPKRSMVIGVAYTLIFEMLISSVPAVINKLTVQYRLRALLMDWADISLGNGRGLGVTILMSDAAAWWHVIILIGYTTGLLILAVALIRWREFSTASELDV